MGDEAEDDERQWGGEGGDSNLLGEGGRRGGLRTTAPAFVAGGSPQQVTA